MLVLSSAQAAYEFDREPIQECWVEINFETEQCQNVDLSNSDVSNNAFAAYGAEEMQLITEELQARLEPLWFDNGGHHQAIIQEGINLYRTYNYCLESLCEKIAKTCSAIAKENSDWQRNYARCNDRKDQLISLATTQLESQLQGNIERKKRSLVVEKMSRLSLRFDEWIHARLSNFNRGIDIAEKAILALAAELW